MTMSKKKKPIVAVTAKHNIETVYTKLVFILSAQVQDEKIVALSPDRASAFSWRFLSDSTLTDYS